MNYLEKAFGLGETLSGIWVVFLGVMSALGVLDFALPEDGVLDPAGPGANNLGTDIFMIVSGSVAFFDGIRRLKK